jgi:hypothetical protein
MITTIGQLFDEIDHYFLLIPHQTTQQCLRNRNGKLGVSVRGSQPFSGRIIQHAAALSLELRLRSITSG